jgi:predicted ester cyclase
MSLHENKRTVTSWFRDFWGAVPNLNVVNEIAAPDMLLQYSLYFPKRGRAAIIKFMTEYREAFPDLDFQIVGDVVAEGSVVVVRWEGGGAQTGAAFNDIRGGALPAASGRMMRFSGTSVFRVENGLILEEVGHEDGLTAMQHLGLIRTPVPDAKPQRSTLPPGWNRMHLMNTGPDGSNRSK